MNSGSPLDDPQSFCRASPPTRLIDVLRLALALGLAEVMGKLVPSKSFRPTADRLLSVVASFILLFLIGCAPRLQANSACPSTVVLRPLASTAIFGPAAVGHPDNVAFYGYLGQVSSNCAYTGDAVQITLDVPVVGERGPVATGQTVDLQFFVAVTGPDQKILSKRPFAARIAFEGVQNRAGVTDHIEETIPLGGRNGSDLNVLLGFQQGPQVVEFYKRFQGRTAEMQPLALPEAPLGTAVGETVRLERRDGGYFVPVRINQTITLPFLLDTGASDLVIPADVALTLIRAGALTSGDFIGKSRYRLANGSEEVSDLVVLREVQVGEHAIRNVTASISPVRGEPLLGQSFLSKFGTVTLDYKRLVLILSR
jgi:predicted aspartyl protease